VITTANNRNINVKHNPFINTGITFFTIIIRNPTIGINIHILITVDKSIHTRPLSIYSTCRCQTLRIAVAGPARRIYKAWGLRYNSNIGYRCTDRFVAISINRIIDVSRSIIRTANNRNINRKHNLSINIDIILFIIITINLTLGINIHILITVSKSTHTRSRSVYSISRCQTLRIAVARPPHSIYKAWDYTYSSDISYRHTRGVKAIERLEQAITILYT